VAPLVDQVSVALPPLATEAGFAVKLRTGGAERAGRATRRSAAGRILPTHPATGRRRAGRRRAGGLMRDLAGHGDRNGIVAGA
jgi:hypothetical protein